MVWWNYDANVAEFIMMYLKRSKAAGKFAAETSGKRREQYLKQMNHWFGCALYWLLK